MGLIVEWLGEKDLDRNLELDWRGLIDRCPGASVFLTPEWITTWWRHYGRGRLRMLSIRRGGARIALAPLVEDVEPRMGLPTRVLKFVGEPQADTLGLLYDADDPAALAASARAIVSEARTVDLVRLAELTLGGAVEQALRTSAREAGLFLAVRAWSRAPVLELDKPWAEIEGAYPRSLRTRLRRARSKQEAAGGLAFKRWLPEPGELPALLEEFRGVEDRSWKGQAGVGIFSPRHRWDFILELSNKFARRGWLDVATLSQGSRIVAYRYGFRFRGVFLDYNLAHTPESAHLSPGRTILDDIIRDSHGLGLTAVDASRGRLDPPHLLADWTSVSRWQSKLTLFSPTVRGRIAALIEGKAKPLARRILRRTIPGPGESP